MHKHMCVSGLFLFMGCDMAAWQLQCTTGAAHASGKHLTNHMPNHIPKQQDCCKLEAASVHAALLEARGA